MALHAVQAPALLVHAAPCIYANAFPSSTRPGTLPARHGQSWTHAHRLRARHLSLPCPSLIQTSSSVVDGIERLLDQGRVNAHRWRTSDLGSMVSARLET